MDQHAGERLHDRGGAAAAALSRHSEGLERRDGNVAALTTGTTALRDIRIGYHIWMRGLWIYRHTDGGRQNRFGPILALCVQISRASLGEGLGKRPQAAYGQKTGGARRAF